MDIVLIAAAASLTAWLPRHLGNQKAAFDASSRFASVTIAFGLSLGLFSLAVLEAIPPSFLVVLDHQNFGVTIRNGYFTIAAAYQLILWTLCLWNVVVVPALVGADLLERTSKLVRSKTQVDRDDDKYSRSLLWRIPWWIRFTASAILKVSSTAFAFFRMGSKNQAQPVLVITAETSPSADSIGQGTIIQRIGANILGQSVQRKSYAFGTIVGLISNFVILRSVGSLAFQSSSEEMQILPTIVSWLCGVGLLLSSVLNGFGSVSLPHSCLVGHFLEPLRPEVVKKAEDDLRKMSAALEAKRCELDSSSSAAPIVSSSRRRSAVSAPNTFSNYADDNAKRKSALVREVDFYEALHEELCEEVADMKYSQQLASMARTNMGRMRSWLGMAFSIVLLVRLGVAILNIWKTYYADNPAATAARADPITTALLWLMGHHLVSPQDYNTLSHFISLLLTAFLSASQVRTFLRTVAAVNRRLSHAYRKCYCTKSRHAATPPSESTSYLTSNVYSHLMGFLMGCYFVSCVILTKMNLPQEYRSDFSAALGGLEFQVQSAVANVVFSASAVVSAITLGLIFGIRRQNTMRHGTLWTDDVVGNLDAC